MRTAAEATGTDIAEAIEGIAASVARLTISRRDPDRFFEERSELAEQLRREARKLRLVTIGGRRLDSGNR